MSMEAPVSAAGVGAGGGGGVSDVVAGNGLTGGGTTATVTLNVGAGDGITVAADAVAVNPSDLAGNGLDVSGGDFIVQPSEIAGLGLETDGGSPAKLRVKAELRNRTGNVSFADGAASTVTTERTFFHNCTGVTLTIANVFLVNRATLAGHDTNNFVITIYVRDTSGVQTTVVSYTNNVASGGVTAYVQKDLGALTDTTLADGESLTYEVTKGGSGQALVCTVTAKMSMAG